MFDDASQGVDKYNHNGSLWAIFTNQMKWVVEFTKDQTLWYNYDFFDNEMKLIGLNSIENKFLIQKWFESRFLGIPKVEDSCVPFFNQDQYVEDTIQNGVKHTLPNDKHLPLSIEDTIQNGVKDTRRSRLINLAATQMVKDTIQNGVKHTGINFTRAMSFLEDTIQNGVKQTELSKRDFFPKDIIQDGVKHTEDGDWLDGDERIGDIIENGVKDKQYTNKR